MKKKLLLSVAVLFSSMLGFAQNSLSMDDVKIAPGQTAQVSVNLNNSTAYTAFQFDMTLPEGITVKEATLADRASGHTLKTGTVNGKYRVLAYSYNAETNEGNKPITGSEGAIVNLTLEAGESVAEGATIVIDAGNQSQDGGQVFVEADGTTNYSMGEVTAAVTTSTSEKIEIPAGGKLAMVSDNALDFTSLESEGVKAYIASGYEYDSRKVWLTRVNQVPGGTPIVVIGEANSTPSVPIIEKSLTYYGENLLKGSATAATNLDWDNNKYFVISKSNGQIGNLAVGTASIAAEKVCIQVPQDDKVASSVKGSDESITIEAGGRLAYVNSYDLDFSGVDGLTAYTVTGFGEKIMWLTEIQIASAGTPLLLKGTPKQKYDVPSTSSQKSYYANMLRGSATEALPVKAVDGDYITLVLSKTAGQYGALGSDVAAFPKGTSYLPVLASYNVKTAATRGAGNEMSEFNSEVICMSIGDGDIDDDATGISRIASEAGNDTWYNLKGQRIDTPTKKGLYIKNGKKVIVK